MNKDKLKGFKTLVRDYHFYLCLLILIGSILCTFFIFPNSINRIIDSFKDFGLSVAYYFCELFYIPYDFEITINQVPTYSGVLVSFPLSWDMFHVKSSLYFHSLINLDTLKFYFAMLLNNLSKISRVILIILPLFFLVVFLYHNYFTQHDKDINEDSKPLKLYKRLHLKVWKRIIYWFKEFRNWLSQHSYLWFIFVIIWLFNFNIFTIVIEFLAYYFYFSLSFDFLHLYIQVYKLLLDLKPMFVFIPFVVWLGLFLMLFNRFRKKIGYQILNHHEMINRGYINSTGQVTMICGEPGTGKTTVLTDFALSQEIMFRDKAFELLLKNDVMFPNFPYPVLEWQLKQAIKYHQIYNLATAKLWIAKKYFKFTLFPCSHRCFDYDYEKYGLEYYDGLKVINLWEMLTNYVCLFFVYVMESSLIVSNYGIRESNVIDDIGNFPMWNCELFRTDERISMAYSRQSHILDFDMLRLGKKVIESNKKRNAFEFGVIVITEGGKERGNALENQGIKKNEDKANQKNDLFNQWLKMVRHSATIDNFPFIKVIIDEQRPESIGADVRSLCEKIIYIRERKEPRTSLMLFGLEMIIYDFLNSFFSKVYYKYRYFRSDNTLFVYALKNLICAYSHYYMRLYNIFTSSAVTVESERGSMDNSFTRSRYWLSHKKIYSNRFATDAFSDYFVNKSLNSAIGINDLQEFTNVKATLEELNSEHSYFIQSIMKEEVK